MSWDATQTTFRQPVCFLPYVALGTPPMRVYDPKVHHSGEESLFAEDDKGALEPGLPPRENQEALPLRQAAKAKRPYLLVPRAEDCEGVWERYGMLEHIKTHSRRVGELAFALAQKAALAGRDVLPEAALAAGLLHDIGKTHCIAHGGHHDQIGAAWVMRETRNGPLAQAVLFHTRWPWRDTLVRDIPLLTLLCFYADKRVLHEGYVNLDHRFKDLRLRYGDTEQALAHLSFAEKQAREAEAALGDMLGFDGISSFTP